MTTASQTWIEAEVAAEARRKRVFIRALRVAIPLLLVYAYFAYFLGPTPWVGFAHTYETSGPVSFAQVGTTYVGLWQGVLPVWKRHLPSGFWLGPEVLSSGQLLVSNVTWYDEAQPDMGAEFNGEMLALDQRGKIVWDFKPPSVMPSNLGAAKKAIVLEQWRDGVLGISETGVIACYRPHLDPELVFTSPLGDKFYYSTEDFEAKKVTLHCLSPKGEEVWRTTATGITINALEGDDQGDVLFTTSLDDNSKCGWPYAGWLYCVDKKGKVRWTYSEKPYFEWSYDLRVLKDHVEYIAAEGKLGTIVSLNFDGKVLSRKPVRSRREWTR